MKKKIKPEYFDISKEQKEELIDAIKSVTFQLGDNFYEWEGVCFNIENNLSFPFDSMDFMKKVTGEIFPIGLSRKLPAETRVSLYLNTPNKWAGWQGEERVELCHKLIKYIKENL